MRLYRKIGRRAEIVAIETEAAETAFPLHLTAGESAEASAMSDPDPSRPGDLVPVDSTLEAKAAAGTALDATVLLNAWASHRIVSKHGEEGHPDCGPTRCHEAIANWYARLRGGDRG